MKNVFFLTLVHRGDKEEVKKAVENIKQLFSSYAEFEIKTCDPYVLGCDWKSQLYFELNSSEISFQELCNLLSNKGWKYLDDNQAVWNKDIYLIDSPIPPFIEQSVIWA